MFQKLSMAFIKEWIMDRVRERTTWNGGAIIAICVLVLLSLPLVDLVAWAGLIYGIWTIVKEEKNNEK